MCENFTRMVNEWRAEGREEGENKRNKEIAMNLLEMSLPLEMIVQATGIKTETLVQMKHQMEVQSA